MSRTRKIRSFCYSLNQTSLCLKFILNFWSLETLIWLCIHLSSTTGTFLNIGVIGTERHFFKSLLANNNNNSNNILSFHRMKRKSRRIDSCSPNHPHSIIKIRKESLKNRDNGGINIVLYKEVFQKWSYQAIKCDNGEQMKNSTACHDRRAYKFDLTTVLLVPVETDDINQWCWLFKSGKKDGNWPRYGNFKFRFLILMKDDTVSTRPPQRDKYSP